MSLHKNDISLLLMLPTIVDAGSINKAADKLNISQPALTRGIQRLEQSVGAQVLERSGRGIEVTALGEALVHHARALDAEFKRTNSTIEVMLSSSRGLVQIGATSTVSELFIMPVLRSYLRRHPNTLIEVIVERRPYLMSLLKAGDLDIVVCPAYDTIEPEVTERPLFELDLEVLARPQHPLARRRTLKLGDVADLDWILPPANSRLFQQLRNEFSKLGLSMPTAVVHTSSLSIMRNLLLSSDRLIVQSRQAFQTELDDGRVVAIRGEWNFGRRAVNLCARDRTSQSPTLNAFVDSLMSNAQDMFPPGGKPRRRRYAYRL